MPEPDDLERQELGARLRQEREYLGFSQDEVAEGLGITRSAVSLIESGQRKIAALELKRLAILYRKSVTYFTEEATEESVAAPVRALARVAKKLSDNDLGELQRFAEFLQTRSKSTRKPRNG